MVSVNNDEVYDIVPNKRKMKVRVGGKLAEEIMEGDLF